MTKISLQIPPSLKYKKFAAYWIGQGISTIGSRMQLWAIFWHLDQITQSPLALGMVGAARIIPIILFSLFGGMVADSFNRKRLLFITQISMAVMALVLFWLTAKGEVELWHIYLLTSLQALATAFDTPARQSILPNLIPRDVLSNALSMSSIAFTAGAIIGQALTGFVIEGFGIEITYLINAVSFLAVIGALIFIGDIPQQVREIKSQEKKISMPALKEGLRFTFGNPVIFASMVLDFMATFFAQINSMMPIFAREVLNVGAIKYGWLVAAQSIGGVITAGVLSQIKQIKNQGRVLITVVIMFGAATALFGFSRSFALSMFALMLAGATDMVSMVIRQTMRQLLTPDHLRGRMTSIFQIFFMGGPQLGEIEAGVVGQFLGVSFAAISGGFACIFGVGLIIWKWPQLAKYRGDEPMIAGSG